MRYEITDAGILSRPIRNSLEDDVNGDRPSFGLRVASALKDYSIALIVGLTVTLCGMWLISRPNLMSLSGSHWFELSQLAITLGCTVSLFQFSKTVRSLRLIARKTTELGEMQLARQFTEIAHENGLTEKEFIELVQKAVLMNDRKDTALPLNVISIKGHLKPGRSSAQDEARAGRTSSEKSVSTGWGGQGNEGAASALVSGSVS